MTTTTTYTFSVSNLIAVTVQGDNTPENREMAERLAADVLSTSVAHAEGLIMEGGRVTVDVYSQPEPTLSHVSRAPVGGEA